jgi:hypothetical protein
VKILHPVLGAVSVRLNHKGYPRINSGPLRGQFLHRAVFSTVAGRLVREGFTVHHMAGKGCSCPWNLVEIEGPLHAPREALRHPFTGRFMTLDDYESEFRRLPDWLRETQPQEATA